jgi:hypothetical protein
VCEELFVVHSRIRVDDGVDRRIEAVLERKHVPAQLAVRVLEHACVQPAENVRPVAGRTRRAHRALKRSSKDVSVERVRRLGEAWPERIHERVHEVAVPE